MAAPSTLSDPGIISLDDNGRLLTTHFRLDLFQDDGAGNKALVINSGELYLSDGFAGSLGAALDADPTLLFDLGAAVDTFLIDDVDNLLALAKALKKQGLSMASFFEGGNDVGVTIDEVDPFKLKQLINGAEFELFDFVTDVKLPAGSKLEMGLHHYEDDLGIDFSGVSKITVTGTIEEYRSTTLDIANAPAIFEFVVLDTETNYEDANNEDPSAFGEAIFNDVDVFGLRGTVTDLSEADFGAGVLLSQGVIPYQAIDTPAAIDLALGNGTVDSLDIQSLVPLGDVATISGAGGLTELAAELSEGDRVTGVVVTDDYSALDGADFEVGLMTIATDVHLVDDAANIPTPLDDSLFPGNPDVVPTLLNLTGGTLDASIDEMFDSEIQAFTSSGGTFNVGGTVTQLYVAEGDLGTGDSVLDLFESFDNVNLIGKDTAANVNAIINDGSLDAAFVDVLAGFEVTADTLFLGATSLYTSLANPLFFNPVGASAIIDVTGSASEIAHPDFDAAGLINPGLGSAIIHVSDDASEIRDNAADLDDDDMDSVATIDGFMADYYHIVNLDDIYDPGPDATLLTADDIATPLVSFEGGEDWYDFQADVYEDGVQVEISGSFDVEWNGISDVLDISNKTGVFSGEDEPASDFAFVDSLFSARQTVPDGSGGNKPAVDIRITEPGSTLIDFDGFTGAYDSIIDFSVFLPDVSVAGDVDGDVDDPVDGDFDDNGDGDLTDIQNGITVRNFFGIPIIDQTIHGLVDGSGLVPNLDLFRFEGVDSYATASQVNDVLYERFYDSLNDREKEIRILWSLEGDILVGDNEGEDWDGSGGSGGGAVDDYLEGDAFAPLVDDVIFGLNGDDDIFGYTGNDFINGGHGDDTIMGGSGDDTITDKYGENIIHGEGGGDYIVASDDGADEIHGGAGNDSIYAKFGDDVIYGDEGADYIEGEDGKDEIYGGLDNDNIFGGNDDDTIHGGDGNDDLDGDSGNDMLFGEYGDDVIDGDGGDDELYGGIGMDTLDGGTGADQLFGEDGIDALYGDDGDDELYGGDDDDALYGEYGDDELFGGQGDDELYGGDDDDILDGGSGNDSLTGGAGTDTADYSDAIDMVTADLADGFANGTDIGSDTLSQIENLRGGAGNDLLQGNGLANELRGGLGNDDIYGGNSADTLFGDGGDDDVFGDYGDDTLQGGAGNDNLDGGMDTDTADYSDATATVFVNLAAGSNQASGADIGTDQLTSIENVRGGMDGDDIDGDNNDNTLCGGMGNDLLNGWDGADVLYGEYGFDTLSGGEHDDDLYGGDHDDTLFGGNGMDDLFGEDGDDRLVGGGDDDNLDGGDGTDTADYSLQGGTLTVDLTAGSNQAVGSSSGTDQLTSIENVIGGAGQDTLIGDGGVNEISGLANNDTITGGGGADILSGGDGDDIFNILLQSDFGDTILDFERITGTDPEVIHDRINLATAALNAGGKYVGGALTSIGSGSFTVIPDTFWIPLTQMTSSASMRLRTGNAIPLVNTLVPLGTEENYDSAFKQHLVGWYAPTMVSVPVGTTPSNSALISMPMPGNFFAFGLVQGETNESVASTGLVMAYIVNGSVGAAHPTMAGLNEITSGEIIFRTTIAVFGTESDAPELGNIFLI